MTPEARTLFDKVWSSHVVAELGGGVSLLAIDRHLLHDLEAGPGFDRVASLGHAIHNPELTFAAPDHSIATDPQRHADSNPNGGRLLREMRRGAFAAGVKLFDLGRRRPGHPACHRSGTRADAAGRDHRLPATAIPARMADSARSRSVSGRPRSPTCSRRRRCARRSPRRCGSPTRASRRPASPPRILFWPRSGRSEPRPDAAMRSNMPARRFAP